MAFHSLADDKVGYRLMYKVWSKNSATFLINYLFQGVAKFATILLQNNI